MARERASSSRRAWPVGSVSAARSARFVSPTRASTASACAAALERSCDQRRRISAAASTFSRTESDPKTSSRWKVRAMPRRARLWGLRPVMSVPSKMIRPALRVCSPQMALKQVVLPAPLGPMRPVTLPASTVRFTPRKRVHATESDLGFRHLQKRHSSPPSASGRPLGLAPPGLDLFCLVRPGFIRRE